MSTSNQLAVDQPTSGADRNPTLADRADPATENILLPSLDDVITLLDIEGSRGVPITQSLVLDHLLLSDGPAFWIDANGHATTTTLSRIAPSQRMLDRIQIARGFTAFQHYSLVEDLDTRVDESASLIVAPAVDYPYRGDNLQRGEPEDLLEDVLTRLQTVASEHDIPVLVTRGERDEFTERVATSADERIICERTRYGPRFSIDEFETLVYPVGDGWFQTTLTYWREVLEARVKASEQLSEGIAHGTN